MIQQLHLPEAMALASRRKSFSLSEAYGEALTRKDTALHIWWHEKTHEHQSQMQWQDIQFQQIWETCRFHTLVKKRTSLPPS